MKGTLNKVSLFLLPDIFAYCLQVVQRTVFQRYATCGFC
jgi:hypothetical protein